MKRSVEGKPGVKERCTKFTVARDRMKIQERDTAADDVPASALDVPAGYTLEEFPLSM